MAIKLIAGLGNPGIKYQNTRHNVGFWFLQEIVKLFSTELKPENKFFAQIAKTNIANNTCWLVQPEVFMNLSGKAVATVANFYKIEAKDILVIHDDLDLPVGTIKLKIGGGHGGHNGLRDIINHLGSNDFQRIRIGIDHPGNSKDVVNFVLKPPSKDERITIDNAIDNAIQYIPEIVCKNTATVMNQLHTRV